MSVGHGPTCSFRQWIADTCQHKDVLTAMLGQVMLGVAMIALFHGKYMHGLRPESQSRHLSHHPLTCTSFSFEA